MFISYQDVLDITDADAQLATFSRQLTAGWKLISSLTGFIYTVVVAVVKSCSRVYLIAMVTVLMTYFVNAGNKLNSK